MSQQGAGTLQFRGSVNEPVSIQTVRGNAATVDTNGNSARYCLGDSGQHGIIAVLSLQVGGFCRVPGRSIWL